MTAPRRAHYAIRVAGELGGRLVGRSSGLRAVRLPARTVLRIETGDGLAQLVAALDDRGLDVVSVTRHPTGTAETDRPDRPGAARTFGPAPDTPARARWGRRRRKGSPVQVGDVMDEVSSADTVVDRTPGPGDDADDGATAVPPETALAEAVAVMTAGDLERLPVVDRQGRWLGIVFREDAERVLARLDRDLTRDVEAALASVGLRDWEVSVRTGVAEIAGPGAPVEDRDLARVVASSVPGVLEVEAVTSSG